MSQENSVTTPNRLLKMPEACALLGISRGTLYQLIKTDKVASIHLGLRSIRIPSTEVDRIIREGGTRP